MRHIQHAMPYKQALTDHATVKTANAYYFDEPTNELHAPMSEQAYDMWNAFIGQPYKTRIADAIVMTMPDECVPILRYPSGTATAFALAAVTESLREVGMYVDVAKLEDFELRLLMSKAWLDFEQRKALANNVREGLGWNRAAAWETVRVVDTRDVYRANLMRAIALLAGRMYETMRGMKARRPNKNPEEVRQTTIGGDIELLLASEHAHMASGGALGDLKAMQVMQRQALQLQMAGEEECDRGPLVIAVDESGSMHGDRNVWAKACAAALMRIAHEEKRDVVIVAFSTSTACFHCKPDDVTTATNALMHFFSGGTAIAPAIDVALRQVKRLASLGQHGADIVLISDGADRDDFVSVMKRVRAADTELWSVAIDCEFPERCECAGFWGSSSTVCTCAHPLRSQAKRYVFVHGHSLVAGATRGLEGAAIGNARRRA